jgi:predicted small lipoprotein YifL
VTIGGDAGMMAAKGAGSALVFWERRGAVALAEGRFVSRIAGAALLAGALALAGCGVKGSLEPPPGAAVAKPAKGPNGEDLPPPKPQRPFFLDPLL